MMASASSPAFKAVTNASRAASLHFGFQRGPAVQNISNRRGAIAAITADRSAALVGLAHALPPPPPICSALICSALICSALLWCVSCNVSSALHETMLSSSPELVPSCSLAVFRCFSRWRLTRSVDISLLYCRASQLWGRKYPPFSGSTKPALPNSAMIWRALASDTRRPNATAPRLGKEPSFFAATQRQLIQCLKSAGESPCTFGSSKAST